MSSNPLYDEFMGRDTLGSIGTWFSDTWKDLTGQKQQQSQYDESMAFSQQQAALQEDLAKNGIQYKAADAEAAGFSKWSIANGGSSVSASTVSAPSPNAGSVNVGAIASIAQAMMKLSQLGKEGALLDSQANLNNSTANYQDALVEHMGYDKERDDAYLALEKTKVDAQLQYWADDILLRNSEQAQRYREYIQQVDQFSQDLDFRYAQLQETTRNNYMNNQVEVTKAAHDEWETSIKEYQAKVNALLGLYDANTRHEAQDLAEREYETNKEFQKEVMRQKSFGLSLDVAKLVSWMVWAGKIAEKAKGFVPMP